MFSLSKTLSLAYSAFIANIYVFDDELLTVVDVGDFILLNFDLEKDWYNE